MRPLLAVFTNQGGVMPCHVLQPEARLGLDGYCAGQSGSLSTLSVRKRSLPSKRALANVSKRDYIFEIPTGGVPSVQGPQGAMSPAVLAVYDQRMRIAIYVDGFNLYYRALRGTGHKWLNPKTLAEQLLEPDDKVGLVRYFTAHVSSRAGDPDAPRRQHLYLKALRTIPEIKIHYGRFLAKTKTRPLVGDTGRYVEVWDTEEKGSDVNLASFLLHDGWSDRYDASLVVSQDSDLLEPIRMVKNDLRKPVGVVWLDGTEPSRRFKNAASFIRHATPSRLAASQFSNPLMGVDGHRIVKPEEW